MLECGILDYTYPCCLASGECISTEDCICQAETLIIEAYFSNKED